MFDIGQNDLAGAFYSKTLDQVLASIPTILIEFETGIKVSFKNTTPVSECFSSSRFSCFLMEFLYVERPFDDLDGYFEQAF